MFVCVNCLFVSGFVLVSVFVCDCVCTWLGLCVFVLVCVFVVACMCVWLFLLIVCVRFRTCACDCVCS